MAKAADFHNPGAVTEYIKKLAEPSLQLVEAIRQTLLLANVAIGEQIKWNSPSFFYNGPMQAFSAKEYKRDIFVLNLRQKDHILLIFPTGAKVNLPILEGYYADGRRMMKIHNMDDLLAKKVALQQVIENWLRLVDKI